MANAGIVQQMSEAPPGGGFVGSDDGDGRRRRSKRHKGGGASQKRKLEKAQEHLRSKMRQRLNGPAMVSSRLHKSSSGGNIHIHDDRKADDLGPKVKTLKRSKAELEKMSRLHDSTKQLTGNYWRTQQDRFSNNDQLRGDRPRHSQEEVPLHELVDRVLKRKEQKSNISPLTIRAYRQPVAPFAIPQRSKIRKVVGGQPASTLRKHPKDKGPYFVVLHREDPAKLESKQQFGNIRGKALQESSLELNTWRPELDKNARKTDSAKDEEDRVVTNYKLQMQHAARLAEARFDYSSSSKNKIQTFNALPPIRSQVDKDSESVEHENTNEGRDVNTNMNARSQSSDEILQTLKNYKSAKRKPSGDDFNTILRTRNRYTAKTKQFKEDLTRAKALSIIDEDQSSVSSDSKTSRCLSGRRPSQTSLRNLSAQSLNKIEETKTPEPDDDDIRNAKTKQKLVETDRSTGVIEEGDEEDDDYVISQESSVSFRCSLELSGKSNSPTLQFSSDNKPLPPIEISGKSSPTNHNRHDRDVNNSSSSPSSQSLPSSSTTQLFGQDSLPSMPIVPEIRKSSASSSTTTNQGEMVEIH